MKIIKRKKKAPLRGYALAVEVLAQIEVSEQDRSLPQWDQGTWGRTVLDLVADEPSVLATDPRTGLPVGAHLCGTAFCFAGWADTLGGKPIVWSHDVGLDDNELVLQTRYGVVDFALEALELKVPERDDNDYDYIGPTAEYWDGAAEPYLFDASNDLGDLYFHVAGLYQKDEQEVRNDVQTRVPHIKGRWTRLLGKTQGQVTRARG